MKRPEIILVPLQPEDRDQFILDNQWAFKYGAQQEFGMRDERCEEGEEVISRKTIENSIDGENAEAYRIVLNGQKVGGVVLQIDKETAKGDLELFLYCRSVTVKVLAKLPGKPWRRCILIFDSGKPLLRTSRSATSTST